MYHLFVQIEAAMKHLNLSDARRNLPSLADEVAQTGEEVLITRHGKPLVRIAPCEAATTGETARYPLRGLPIRIASDFDEPMPDAWEAENP